MSTWMRDIFNRTHPSMGQPVPQPSTMPAPTLAPPNPQGAMGNLMSNFPQPAPQPQPQLGQMTGGDLTPKDQFLAMCGIPPQREDMSGGTDRIGQRTASGDTGLQGANMPQPQRPPWLDGLRGNTDWGNIGQISGAGNDSGWLLPSTGGGMGGMGGAFGAVSSAPQPSAPFTYGGFAGGAPQQGGPMQMPSAPFQAGMRAGSVGNQMGGLNNMYSNFAAPSPMPAPPPPMFGAPAGNSKAMMGPRPVGIF